MNQLKTLFNVIRKIKTDKLRLVKGEALLLARLVHKFLTQWNIAIYILNLNAKADNNSLINSIKTLLKEGEKCTA